MNVADHPPRHEPGSPPARERSTLDSRGTAEDDLADEPRHRRPGEPERVGRYLVLGTLGRGGMGTVLEAFDRTLDRRVAVKILHHELGQRHTRRLLREAQAMAKLSHPNVVQVYEVGEVDGQLFVAMELVRGQTLAEWIAQTPRPGWRRCVEVFLQVGAGLSAAHAQGLVHRDFKPGNAIIDPHGRARVLDFGLARHADGDGSGSSPRELVEERPASQLDLDSGSELDVAALDTPLTRTGAVLGTPAYMPPEQMKGGEVGAHSDQFSFCVSLYEALYGERPFEGTSLMTLFVSMTSGHVRPPPKGTDVPAKLRQVVLRGLAVEPDARWPSMDALLGELRRLVAPTSRRFLALALVGGLAATGVGLAYWAEVGLRCEGAAAQLEGVWDETRAQRVHDAILGTGQPHAADTWARVQGRLDAYSGAWVGKHTEVCEATRVHEEQSLEVMDLRMACLARRRIELQAAVGVLAHADAAQVSKAVGLVEGLPALAECDDVEVLAAAQAELPPPEDPHVAEQVETERARLAEAAARHELGDYAGSEAAAHAVVEQADVLGYGPLRAEALLRRGSARSQLGRHAEAEADLEAAHVLALRHDHDRVQLDATMELAYVVGYQLGRHAEGLRWAAMAEALAHVPGASDTAKADAWTKLAAVLLAARRSDEAVEHYRRALALLERVHGPLHPDVAVVTGNLASALVSQGKLEEAAQQLERALAVSEEVLGPRHPALASLLGNLGAALAMQGRLSEAQGYFERGVALKEELLGPRHFDVAIGLGNLGLLLLELGRVEQGEARQATLDRSHERLARALAIMEEITGPRAPQVAAPARNLGHVLLERGELAEARASYQRALDITVEAVGHEHPDVANVLEPLAEVALAQHDEVGARVYAERAVAIREAGEVDPHAQAQARFLLARVLWEDPERRVQARALAEEVRDTLGRAPASDSAELAEVEAWLAAHRAP